jgi:opacity protein-like surface antigen
MIIKRITLLGSAIMMVSLMHCAYATAEGTYLGFLAGVSDTNNKTENVQLGTNPETSVPVVPTNTGLAGGLIIGYGFNPYAAFEFGYIHYAASTYAKPEGSQLTHDSTINTNAIDIAMKGSLPFKAVSLFGKVGLMYVSASGSGSLSPINSGKQPNNNALRPMYALGAGYDLTQNWVVDVSYTTFTGGSGVEGAELLALGVTYHFVDLLCGQFLC